MNLLRAIHKDVVVKFEVEGYIHEVNCSIGVKQGDVLGPVLFTIFMVGVMSSWRRISDQPQCIFLTREDSVMTGRKTSEVGETFALDDSECGMRIILPLSLLVEMPLRNIPLFL